MSTINKLFAKTWLILAVIILIAAFLRLYQLSTIPGSLNQDEAALGYNAYAILKTGADEHGKFLPLALQSFGDWKLPFYSYITIPFILLFGLNEVAVRLPSALSGIIDVYLIYKVMEILFKDKKIGLFAAFLFALSPMSIFFSRVAFEVNLATTLFLGGYLSLIYYLTAKQKAVKYLVFTIILFGLTLFTYISYVLFIPLFLLGMCTIFFKRFSWSWSTICVGIVMVILIIGSFINITINGSNKVSTLSILNNPNVIYQRADVLKGDGSEENKYIEKILYNKYTAEIYQFGQNYIGNFSPVFLFDGGGDKLQYTLGYFGNFYLLDAILLIGGLLAMFWDRERSILYLIPWFLIGPIPTSLTVDTPNGTRIFLLLPLAIIIMAYAAAKIFNLLSNLKFGTIMLCIISLLYIINIVYFIDGYFVHFNTQRMRFWRYGNKQAVLLTNKYPTYSMVMRGPEDFHYIYFLFYDKYDPRLFQKQVTYYPLTSDGFLYVKSFGRFHFVPEIDFNNLSPNTIYIDDQGVTNMPNTINLPSGQPILGYTIIGNEKK